MEKSGDKSTERWTTPPPPAAEGVRRVSLGRDDHPHACSRVLKPSPTPHVFIGEYQHSIDPKGRLAVPAKFRAGLSRATAKAKGAVVTRGLDQSLFLYPAAEWQKLAERLSQLPISQANTRAFARLMLAGAMDVEVDSQGRVLIPEYLRTYAGLRKQVILAGLYNRIELWDHAAWQRYKSATEKKSGAIAEQLGALGV